MAACAATLQPVGVMSMEQSRGVVVADDDDVFLSESEFDDRVLQRVMNRDTHSTTPGNSKIEHYVLPMLDSMKVSGGLKTKDGSESSDDEIDLILQQPRRASDINEFQLPPSVMEKKLQNYRILSEGGMKLKDVSVSPSLRRRNGSKEVGHENDECGVVEALPVARNNESHDNHMQQRYSSIWNGLVACLSPVMGLVKKEDQHLEKKDNWEIPFADIRELDFIGSGAQGAVFVGEYLGEKIAVKKVKNPTYCDEARHLRKLSHPNIVKFM